MSQESGEEDVEGTLEWLLTNAATYGGDQCLEVDPDTIGDPILQLDLQVRACTSLLVTVTALL